MGPYLTIVIHQCHTGLGYILNQMTKCIYKMRNRYREAHKEDHVKKEVALTWELDLDLT